MDTRANGSDSITLDGLAFYAYHGALPEERTLGQRFTVDVRLELDLMPAGAADDLAQAIDYAAVWLTVRDVVEGPPLALIEAVAHRVALAILARFERVEAVGVRVRKPSAPIQGAASGNVAVEVFRRHSASASEGRDA